VIEANQYPGPAIVNVFTTCQPEHGVGDVKEDWCVHPKTGEQIDFVYFARTEGRFSKHFDKDGNPSPTLLAARDERLENWRLLQELAGVK
jgi:pyruvate ferredoxin oxidoreductase beta subunit